MNTAPFKLLTGHLAKPTLPVLGYWLIETEPGSEVFLFSHDPLAKDIMKRHNELYEKAS